MGELLFVDDDELDDSDMQSSEDTSDTNTHSFMPFPIGETTEDEAIRTAVGGSSHTDWPDIEHR